MKELVEKLISDFDKVYKEKDGGRGFSAMVIRDYLQQFDSFRKEWNQKIKELP